MTKITMKRSEMEGGSKFALVCVIVAWLLVAFVVYWGTSTVCVPDTSHPKTDGLLYSLMHRMSANNVREDVGRTRLKQACYYAIPRLSNGMANLTTSEIDPTLCTHLIIAGAIVQNTTIVPLEEGDVEVYAKVVALKKQNPDLRVLLCVANGFPALVRDSQAIAIFAYNAKQFLLTHKLDGLDLDWEFPAWPAWKSDPREKKWFTDLVRQLNNAMKLASHPPMILTLAVGTPRTIVDASYEVDQLAKYVDYVSLMGYDYHMFETYLPFTGHNGPLFKGKHEEGYLATLNIAWSTNYWIQKGMPKEKIVVGIPTYGRSWKLLSSAWHNVGAPAVGKGFNRGVVTYIEACIFIKEGATRHFDNYSRVPYATRELDWVSYEDPQSIKEKAQWIKDAGVAGVMSWVLNSDDFAGVCSGRKFELLNIVKEIIRPTLDV